MNTTDKLMEQYEQIKLSELIDQAEEFALIELNKPSEPITPSALIKQLSHLLDHLLWSIEEGNARSLRVNPIEEQTRRICNLATAIRDEIEGQS